MKMTSYVKPNALVKETSSDNDRIYVHRREILENITDLVDMK